MVHVNLRYRKVSKPSGRFTIIDGVIKSKDEFQKIDPNDIESVTILKDKPAIALYGKAGENGVVMIETKNAKKRKKND